MPTFDSVNLTQSSESSPRLEKMDTLQIHHATLKELAALRGLMSAGGRQVSANGAMGNDGHLMLVVPLNRRAFTSASYYDHRSLTVEVCNTTLAPSWGISYACHVRLAKLAVEMYREGLLGAISRKFIIGHREVPGSYATACPGPSMDLDLIVELALAMNNQKKEADMDGYEYIFKKASGNVPQTYALLHPTQIEGGYRETTSLATAEGWNLAIGRQGREVSAANWAKTLKAAADLAQLARAVGGPSTGPAPSFPDPAEWGAAAAAAFKADLPEFSASGKFE